MSMTKTIIPSVAFILLKDNKILVEKRKMNKSSFPGKIAVPSGGIEAGETSEQALWRETKEEFDIKVTDYAYIGKYFLEYKEVDFDTYYYVVTTWTGEIQNKEAEELIWINKNDTSKLDISTDVQAVEKLENLVQKKVFALIKSNKNNYLLLRTNPEWLQTTAWYVVTGALDEGESFSDACRREIKEETQLSIVSIKETKRFFEFEWPKDAGIKHYEKVFFVTVNEQEPVLSVEHLEYKWLPKKEFIEQIGWYGDKSNLEEMLEEFD
jgi:8-oxo-dGTP diphosphatase